MGLFSLFGGVSSPSPPLRPRPNSAQPTWSCYTTNPSPLPLSPLQRSELDYETLLSLIETKIQSRQARLQTIQLRERRATALTITWGLGAWVVYVALWYFHVFRQNAVNGVPVIAGPVV